MTRLVTDWKGEQTMTKTSLTGDNIGIIIGTSSTKMDNTEGKKMTKDKALKLAIEALEACKEALEQPAQEVECSNHPDAPHGFCRDASHIAGRYVCECEGWKVEQPAQDYVLICKRCGDDLGIEYVPDEQPAQECKLCTARDINFDDDIIVDNYEIKLYNELDEYPDNSKDA
jgi:hypothetical protein